LEQEFTVTEIHKLTLVMFNSVESELVKSVLLKDGYVRRVTSEILNIKNILYHKNLSKALSLKELWSYTKHTYKNNLELRQLLTLY